MRVSKRPITVNAWQFPDISPEATVRTGSDTNAPGVPFWVLIAIGRGQVTLSVEGPHSVENSQGSQSALPGDWLMRGVEGEIYPCPASVFEATYDFSAEDASEKPFTERELEELCGYVGDGSHTTMMISQDDATREWIVTVGGKTYFGRSMRQALRAAGRAQ